MQQKRLAQLTTLLKSPNRLRRIPPPQSSISYLLRLISVYCRGL